jgi:glycosyltransferase involved in cell wall biosynthesis
MKPLVTCICITKNSINLLKQAVYCFNNQDYEAKELLIVYESDNADARKLNTENTQQNIIFIEVPIEPKTNLGELRNMAIEKSSGVYFCQWDDDDWYGAKRLSTQIKTLEENNSDANFLSYWIFFDTTTNKGYISHKRNWEGSIVCKKEIITNQIKYASLAKREDTPFIEALESSYNLSQVENPLLYLYCYHGCNTWDYPHFVRNFELSHALTDYSNELLTKVLNGEPESLFNNQKLITEIDDYLILNSLYS